MRAACEELGVEIRTAAAVERINVANSRATGVTLESGQVFDAGIVVSNADPKRTFLRLVEQNELDGDFRRSIENIRMDGPAGKVNYVLSEEPDVNGMPPDRGKAERSLFTLIPTLAEAEDNYHASQQRKLPERLWVDCVLASNADETLAPPRRKDTGFPRVSRNVPTSVRAA